MKVLAKKFEKYFDKLQPYFGPEKNQVHYMDTDIFALTSETKNIIKDLKNL